MLSTQMGCWCPRQRLSWLPHNFPPSLEESFLEWVSLRLAALCVGLQHPVGGSSTHREEPLKWVKLSMITGIAVVDGRDFKIMVLLDSELTYTFCLVLLGCC